jgi:hypothetical protein
LTQTLKNKYKDKGTASEASSLSVKGMKKSSLNQRKQAPPAHDWLRRLMHFEILARLGNWKIVRSFLHNIILYLVRTSKIDQRRRRHV